MLATKGKAMTSKGINQRCDLCFTCKNCTFLGYIGRAHVVQFSSACFPLPRYRVLNTYFLPFSGSIWRKRGMYGEHTTFVQDGVNPQQRKVTLRLTLLAHSLELSNSPLQKLRMMSVNCDDKTHGYCKRYILLF